MSRKKRGVIDRMQDLPAPIPVQPNEILLSEMQSDQAQVFLSGTPDYLRIDMRISKTDFPVMTKKLLAGSGRLPLDLLSLGAGIYCGMLEGLHEGILKPQPWMSVGTQAEKTKRLAVLENLSNLLREATAATTEEAETKPVVDSAIPTSDQATPAAQETDAATQPARRRFTVHNLDHPQVKEFLAEAEAVVNAMKSDQDAQILPTKNDAQTSDSPAIASEESPALSPEEEEKERERIRLARERARMNGF